MLQPAAASAPGKVLLAGGYLVLDREHTGLVFGLDARIHVIVRQDKKEQEQTQENDVFVKSPQFKEAEWRYRVRSVGNGGERSDVDIVQIMGEPPTPTSKNTFVETALAYTLSYISTIKDAGPRTTVHITILADDDYYSSSKSPPPSPRTSRHTNFAIPLSSAHKTGLGSSAALVTSFIAALLDFYLPPSALSLSTPRGKARLHNLAQAAHSAAQGKVGSGFDVASAVYGSCMYRRFSPEVLSGLGEAGSSGFAERLKNIVEQDWDVQVEKSKVTVPKGLRLVMCDVDCGSQTPGMVRQVLAWRKEKRIEADALWASLQKENEGLAAELVRLAGSDHGEGYDRLREVMGSIRMLTREMSSKSGVPIEPDNQTRLLDACEGVKGVIGGVIPGAGGFDAAALLIEDQAEVLEALEGMLGGWRVEGQEGRVRLLGVREEMEGVRAEEPEQYTEWRSAD